MSRTPVGAARQHSLGVAIRRFSLALLLAGSCPAAALAQACVPDTTPDWITSIPLGFSSAQVRPADCATTGQTPPDFSWPDLSLDARYEVTLTYPDGHSKTLTAPQNWINWDEVLPPGAYTWRVQVTDLSGIQLSRPRRFTVAAGAIPFLVPEWNVLFERATAKARPRALPDAATLQAMLSQRQTELGLLYARVDSRLLEPVQPEPTSTVRATIVMQTNEECRRALEAAFAWVATNREEYRADALRRALNLAAWNPYGVTSYPNVDEAARAVAWTLTLAYDWMHARLDVNQRSQLIAAILARASDMYADLIGSRARVAIHPYDSHGNHTLTHLSVIAVLLAGDVPEAQSGLRDTLPLALSWISPWGGEDGGFGNGTAYSQWTTGDHMLPWYILRWVLNIDVAQKAWVRNHASYFAHFLPPGTPVGAFGDGAELDLRENWASFGRGYSLFAPSPLGRWYASQVPGGDLTRLELLLAPPDVPGPAPYPEGTPDGALLPSIGWAAMHSSLADPARVSVYFKSSSYGSYNHSHADQNSFVVNAGGRALAIDSGHFDDYDTPHWRQWYKQTRAHNAITYDGGQGQTVLEESGRLGPGVVTGYLQLPDYDIVSGDATQAYGGVLKEARRSLVYLRPNLAIVYDRLASDVPRRWEWNIHALNAMTVHSGQRISIHNDAQSLCVDMLASPAVQFAQTDLFTADPLNGKPRQWHGNFGSVETLASAEFIALLNVGCVPTAAGATKANGVWRVLVGERAISITADGSIWVGAASDATSPTVVITTPAPGAVVSGAITVAAVATDNVGVVGVQFQYDGVNFGAEATNAPYSTIAHTNNVPNGTYSFTAVARDAAGNTTLSAPVTITVSNP
jgi:heparinase II/III-like protein/uncharacterized protein DUF4962/Big-like domain-containing protein